MYLISDQVLTESHGQCDLIFHQAECFLTCTDPAFLVSVDSFIKMHAHPKAAMNRKINNSW